ncbi:SGNH/GDSL hydrolase family protein [Rufibacter sp. XAAS-G3-1]|uniref:SGNH/GDSL hydrolase family protein n=1 Tax=Rufibacter sp. XAAS-G3-1 TaxID=2729134 RepID=UPI0015E67AFD|nr:SGNH/GDSL hydrolase family protein [Rufibacter sp. XAAS-G3-1]
MKNVFYRWGATALLSSAFLFTGCEPEFEDDITVSRGDLDLSKYVAVGNSLTAGYQDNGLYLEGQAYSYPNILANQFSYAGGGPFAQPLFSQAQGNGSGYLRLAGFTATGSPLLVPVTDFLATESATSPFFKDEFTTEVQNFGIPGIRLSDIKTPGYGSAQGNPYFERITPDANQFQTYLARVSASNPTFFSSWLGNNDVLGYATAGGFSGTITPVATFTSLYTELITAMTANGAEGIVATIPDVRSVPFFTTVGPTAKPLLTAAVAAAQAQGLPITGVSALTKNTPARITITPASIKDASGGSILLTLTSSAYLPLIGQPTGRYWRELAASQSPTNAAATLRGYLTTFQIDTTRAFGLDPRNPVPSAFVLDDTEQAEINTATIAYNNAIKAQATAKNLAVFDAYEFFNSIQGGFMLNGVAYSPAFITGNLFSLDGVHPTQRGYAIIANRMIEAINAKYGATIPTIDVTQFRAVLIP